MGRGKERIHMTLIDAERAFKVFFFYRNNKIAQIASRHSATSLSLPFMGAVFLVPLLHYHRQNKNKLRNASSPFHCKMQPNGSSDSSESPRVTRQTFDTVRRQRQGSGRGVDPNLAESDSGSRTIVGALPLQEIDSDSD